MTKPAWEPRVLVVDDDELSRLAAKTLLEQLGLTVDLACDGGEALAMTARRLYVAIFMDCGMPEVDGYAATRAINQREGHADRTPVIAMTSHPRQVCLAAGMDDYLAKPLQLDVLRRGLKKHGLLPRDRAKPDEHLEACAAQTPLLKLPAGAPPDSAGVVPTTRFIEQAAPSLRELWQAANAGDGSSMGRISREFRDRAAAVGATRIADLSDRMSRAAEAGDTDLAARLEPLLQQTFTDTAATVDAYLQTSAAREQDATPPPSGAGESTGRVRVAIADDDPLARLAIGAMVEAVDGLALVGCADGVEEIVELVTVRRPDVVVLDWLMPHGGGPAAGRRIRAVSPETVLIGLTSSESEEARLEMAAAGATDFLLKGCPAERLARTIRHAFEDSV